MAEQPTQKTRREFIKETSAGVAIGALGAAAVGGSPARAAVPAYAQATTASSGLPRKRLGKTNVEVPVLGAGTGLMVTPILLNRLLDAGVTYIDTAEGYGGGRSETAVGKILEANGRRDECFIVTKTTERDPNKIEQNLDESLKRLRTDHVELFYLHQIDEPELLSPAMEKKAAELIASGKIQHFGFSAHDPHLVNCLERAAEVGFVEAIMLKYNFRDYDNVALNQALDKCHAADIGLIAMKTQGGAQSFQDRVDPFKTRGLNQYQATLRAVYEDERITAIVSAMKNVRQVEQNAEAARSPALSQAEREALHEYRVATSTMYCHGHCAQECMSRIAADTNVPDIMRHLMYYEHYGDRRQARTLFGRLPDAERRIAGVDFSAAEAACPHGLAIGEMMGRAQASLA